MIHFGTIKYGIQSRASARERVRNIRGESSGSCSDDDACGAGMSSDERVETHMCPRCHEQFQRVHEFLHHKRLCDAKAAQMGEDRMHSDPEDMVVSGDEEMDEPGGKRLEEVRRHRQDAENNNSLEEGDNVEPTVGFPFAAAGHVTLEALQNTRVAVAQFAATAMANNADNEAAVQELAVLQSTLFTLQHQQVFQLQLIQQLQSQLQLNARVRKDDCPLTPPPPAIEPKASSPVKTIPPREATPVRPEPPIPRTDTPATQTIPSTHSQNVAAKAEPPVSKPPTPPMMSHPPYSSISSSLASTIITNNDPPPALNAPNTLEMLQRRAQEVLDNASQGLLANNLADELAFRKSGKMSPYDGKSGGRNEPFFKHRCRYCGKVFGSDSALQIHIRSHTGERPFKCNVCGSRFTTKGNLKVHFQRHTSKFPHVKMNPNPIPEHLDKYHPPILAQLSPGPMGPMPSHPMQFQPGGPSPFGPALSLYRPQHHEMPQHRPLMDKPMPPHPMFVMRSDEQDLPADLSKPTPPSPVQPSLENLNRFKIEPHEDHRESSFEENERLTPKREPEDIDGLEHEHERYASPSPYDDCSTDSKYDDDDMERESPHMKHDPEQPENLSCSSGGARTSTPALSSPPFATPSPRAASSPAAAPASPLLGAAGPLLGAAGPLMSAAGPLSSLAASVLGGSPFSPLGLALGPAMRGNTTCNICYKTFACNSALEIHYRSHTKERPFKCNVCDRGFSTKSSGGACRCRRRPAKPQHATALNAWNAFVFPGNMKQHMLTHKIRDMAPHGSQGSHGSHGSQGSLGSQGSHQDDDSRHHDDSLDEPPTLHEALKRSPPQQSSLDHSTPKRPAVGPQPSPAPAPVSAPLSTKHLCGVCRKNFSSSSALQIHMRTHTGDKPFRCAVCQKAFTTKGNLKVHMGTHMWSSGASRRGRRMSLELPPRPGLNMAQESHHPTHPSHPPHPHPHDLLRRPDLFYPFMPSPFLNGMQQKLNEISVIQQNATQNGMVSPGAKFPPGLLSFGNFPPPGPAPVSRPSSPLAPPPASSPREAMQLVRELAERDRDRDAFLREFAARQAAAVAAAAGERDAMFRELAERGRAAALRELNAREADNAENVQEKRAWELHYEQQTTAPEGDEPLSPTAALPLIAQPSRSEGLTV